MYAFQIMNEYALLNEQVFEIFIVSDQVDMLSQNVCRDQTTISCPMSINQSINVYLYSPISQMLHLSRWTSQFVQNISMTIRHPLSLDPHIVQGKNKRVNYKTTFVHFTSTNFWNYLKSSGVDTVNWRCDVSEMSVRSLPRIRLTNHLDRP